MQPDPRQKKPDDHMWRDCVEGRVVDDWQNADDAVTQRLR